ncbi:MAG: M48 family metallopeptidase, partial [Bacilli bacterium]|nr:M48 family metallopeptidase [Bacilli bacterium]
EIIKTPPFSLRIRKMKTRWGVCNYKSKTITLNSELIRYRKNMLRYVIVHEMCYFYHHNHSAAFWKKVSEYYPEYKMARKELRS